MFFLLPIIAGVAATAISAGEVALGVTAAVGVGAAVKKSIDTKQANEIMRYSEEKFYNECAKLQNESNETQHKIEKANQIKRELNAGILNNSMHVLNSYRNRNLLEAEQFAEDIDIECENIENKIVNYKTIRKQIGEGIKLMDFLSKELSCCLNHLNKEQSIENVFSSKIMNTHFDQITMFAAALKKIMEVDPDNKNQLLITEDAKNKL